MLFQNGILSDADLIDMGISNTDHRETLLKSAESLPTKVKEVQELIKKQSSDKADEEQIADWLSSISLESYVETFKKHLFVEMERIKKIWEVELTAVLEISKPAHRKRILISLDRLSSGPNLDQISSDLNQLVSTMKKTFLKILKCLENGTINMWPKKTQKSCHGVCFHFIRLRVPYYTSLCFHTASHL